MIIDLVKQWNEMEWNGRYVLFLPARPLCLGSPILTISSLPYFITPTEARNAIIGTVRLTFVRTRFP